MNHEFLAIHRRPENLGRIPHFLEERLQFLLVERSPTQAIGRLSIGKTDVPQILMGFRDRLDRRTGTAATRAKQQQTKGYPGENMRQCHSNNVLKTGNYLGREL